MGDVLKEAQSLKESAKSNRDFGDFDDALEDLEAAVALLIAELDQIGVADKETTLKRRQELSAELADCYGMEGGIYRRKKDLESAIRMVAKGRDVEQAPENGLCDSYNLTNWLNLRLLANPQGLRALQPEIRDAAALVDLQVEEKRRDQWWAWADLGVLSLLAGDPDKARTAYVRFKEKGALARHFKSTIEVLEELRDALEPVDREISASIAATLETLRREMPSR